MADRGIKAQILEGSTYSITGDANLTFEKGSDGIDVSGTNHWIHDVEVTNRFVCVGLYLNWR